MAGRVESKVCVVTGGAGSLGLASAALLAREGGRVLLVDRDEDRLEAARAQVDAPAGNVAAIAADVASADETRRYLDHAVERWGKIDVLFSNAGISGAIAPVTDYPEDVFDAVMAVNVRAAFLACKYGLPRMNDGGSVIVTSSVVGVTSDPGICAYATSKHAVIGLVRTVAKEAAARNIRVNVLAPGPIDNSFQTEIEHRISDAIGRDATAMIDARIPLGRHAAADEVARMALFLASDEASFSTGGVYLADGGFTI
jgi:NAD(P)-dependent dehydrogenase (short-subunit alcohol dehydrogenase family)